MNRPPNLLRLRVVILAAMLVAPAVSQVPALAGQKAVRLSPIIAILDTGILPTHYEFNYRGRHSSTDQLVGWWDFTTDTKGRIVNPKPGQVWDNLVPEPYDDSGHGTGVAAMVVGVNRDPSKTPSAAPGYRFAVGKVLSSSGQSQAALGIAIRWAVRTVHASVINLSVGSDLPAPAALAADDYAALDEARAAGVLVVVANGNGFEGLGLVPGEPGWACSFSSSTSVLSVGGSGPRGYLVSTDPQVVASLTVRTATATSDIAYQDVSGTSFAAPFVAGFAARLIDAARRAREPSDPARMMKLIEYSALDTPVPPQFEGYGVMGLSQLGLALSHARAGTLPPRPVPDISGMYVEGMSNKLRDLWSNRLRSP